MTDTEASERPRRYALIPTHNRPTQLASLVRSLEGSCEVIVVIDNASDPPVRVQIEDWDREISYTWMHVIRDEEQPPNLSRLWNVGLAAIHALQEPESRWDVAVLNDDTELPAGWYDQVATALREYDVIAASGDQYGHVQTPLIRHQPDGSLVTRMCPWAFMIRGECGIEADEQFRWWFGDTDLDWRMRIAGGVVVLPGLIAKNTGANSTTHGELAEQAGRDGETFAAKWGRRPW